MFAMKPINALKLILVLAATAPVSQAFVPWSLLSPSPRRAATASSSRQAATATTTTTTDNDLATQKKKLLGLLKPEPTVDPILADPLTKEPLVVISSTGTIIGGQSRPNKVKYTLKASPNATVYEGSSLSYINLLEPVDNLKKGDYDSGSSSSSSSFDRSELLKQFAPFVPPPLRAALNVFDEEYVPMRDLFTSPAVSYAYERGWRQNFATAGFPGPDQEATLGKFTGIMLCRPFFCFGP